MKTYFSGMVLLLSIMSTIQVSGQSRPDHHAPIGVMGDHTHARGEWMFSYRFMQMGMKDNLADNDEISPDEIVTTIPNRFFGAMGQPPTLRVVPLDMTMQMHMIGVMYAPTDRLTLMAMGMYLSNTMDHVTYAGGMGTNILGRFTTQSSGFGDLRLTGLYRIHPKWHVNLGVSIPIGALDEEDQVLTPMDMQPELRMPYPMQLGSGTWDLLPAITYFNKAERFSYGTQLSANLRLGENENGYALGNQLLLTAWGASRLADWLSTSIRLSYRNLGQIDGIDPDIVAPVQTADPDFSGGQWVDGYVGINLIGQSGIVKDQRLSAEFGLPLYQSLNGPQLKTRSVFTIGWQYAF